ncbi:MAG: aldo/keto reductase [Myxococcales bacterium]|nr:aldo/keto reductase [Myxococcales bacterium]
MSNKNGEDSHTPQNIQLDRRKLLAIGSGTAMAATSLPSVVFAEGQTPQVPRRVLGKTGQKIPILLFGAAVKLDRRFDPKLAEAFRFGIDYIDAADCYNGGACEERVGNFWTRAKLKRDDFWITSKSDEHDPEGLERTLDNGLKQLQTNYVNLYFLHGLKNPDYLSSGLEKKVATLKKSGKIRHFGFSCHDGNVAELLQMASKLPWIDAIMFRYNFRKYGDKELNKAIDAAHKANIGLIAMKTQGSEASFRDAWKKFEKTGRWNKHQAVLKAVWDDKRITAAVSHMQSLQQLRENVEAAVDNKKLTQSERSALDRYAEATRSLACDGCDHICNPHVDAPVEIGATLRHLMYHEVYGEPAKARLNFVATVPAAARNLRSIDFSRAEAACPNGVAIGPLMERAFQVLNASPQLAAEIT